MLDGPVRCIGSIYVQLNADLEDLAGLLPVEVVVSNEGGQAPLEIMKPVLMMTTVAHSVNSLTSSS